jgi:hypothetical protein
MLSKDLIAEAIRYNMRAISKGMIDINVLPYPFCDCSPVEFVAWTYAIQLEKGMNADGKFDPELFDFVRTDDQTVDIKLRKT